MNLPAASPNIGRILYYNADIQNKEVSLSNDRVQVQGMAHLDVLYSSLEGQLEWYDAMVPFFRNDGLRGGGCTVFVLDRDHTG